MNAHELYQAGKLNDAVASLIELVKKNPMDQQSRGLLCEFMIVQGQFERADKQLDLLAHQSPEQLMGISLFRQLIRAVQAREQFFSEGRVPEVLLEPDEHMQQYFQASIALREHNFQEAQRILSVAEEQRNQLSGVCNGEAFNDFRDADDGTAAIFEVLTSTGKYYWVPIEFVKNIIFHKPERPLDLLWRRATFETKVEHAEGDVYIPTTYFCDDASQLSEDYRLGRKTDWLGAEDEPVRGIGQRLYLVGDEALSIMDFNELIFA